jgi:archaellum component FlaC
MAIPALKFESEEPVEDRIGKLEAHVEHIRADVADTRIEVRRLNDKVDGLNQTLSAKIDGVNQTSSAKTDAVDQRLSAKIDEVKDALASLALRMEKLFAELKIGRALDRVWWLLMCGTLLGVMARGFKWI